ncbi:MAG: CHAT domain-containing protein, partial [Bacteroidota bacterium]
PFQALQTDNGDFLIQDYAISYAYAAPLLFEPALARNAKAMEERFIGFGISYEDILKRIEGKTTRSATDGVLREMGQLPYATQEVLTSAKITGGKYYLNEDATKNTFLEEGANGEILHLSMHGLIKPNPMESALVFRDQKAGEYDLLTMQEVLSGSYPNKLTILSACHTGEGPLETSEGMLSMGRAFTFVGSESTITSSWAAHDEVTHDVLIAFYEQLRNGASKDIAMQAAIKKLLVEGSPSDRQPINWANLTLIGPVAPIYGDFPWGWALGGLALVLLSLGWWWRSRV